MNPTATIQDTWPRRVHSKIVGTTFDGRQEILAECRRLGVQRLELVREPDNRYDNHAVAVEAQVGRNRLRLGYLSNSDRLCHDCGNLVGGSLFDRSRTLRCQECGHVFGYTDPVVGRRDNGETFVECPKCSESVDFWNAKVVACPDCGGIEYGRGGLATRFSRALAAGIHYDVRVMEYTGGDAGSDGKLKSMGCNIVIQRREE